MEKKDSIQTIDEEEAVISIEELMNRANKKEEVVEEHKEEIDEYVVVSDNEYEEDNSVYWHQENYVRQWLNWGFGKPESPPNWRRVENSSCRRCY